MSRKVHRVPVYFDTKGISVLPFEEIKCILRGADEIIMQGGRSLLAKILKGSKDKKVIELKLKPKVMIVQYFALGISAMKHSGFLAFLVRLSPILSLPHPSKYYLQYLCTIPLNMNLFNCINIKLNINARIPL